jgi:ABC-type dipeptide/oligopeptide/nickel transport system ATPase component
MSTPTLAHLYTRGSTPRSPLARVGAPGWQQNPGQLPSSIFRPSGCSFHFHCFVASRTCRLDEPALWGLGEGQSAACWLAEAALATQGYSGIEFLFGVGSVVSHYFPGGAGLERRGVHAVDGVSASLTQHETVGLMGESGYGESSLARCVIRLVDVSASTASFEGCYITHSSQRELWPVGRRLQMIFQDSCGLAQPPGHLCSLISETLIVHKIGDRIPDAGGCRNSCNSWT